MENETVVR